MQLSCKIGSISSTPCIEAFNGLVRRWFSLLRYWMGDVDTITVYSFFFSHSGSLTESCHKLAIVAKSYVILVALPFWAEQTERHRTQWTESKSIEFVTENNITMFNMHRKNNSGTVKNVAKVTKKKKDGDKESIERLMIRFETLLSKWSELKFRLNAAASWIIKM